MVGLSQHNALLDTCDLALKRADDASVLVFFTHHRPHLMDRDMNFFVSAKERGWFCQEVLTQKFKVRCPRTMLFRIINLRHLSSLCSQRIPETKKYDRRCTAGALHAKLQKYKRNKYAPYQSVNKSVLLENKDRTRKKQIEFEETCFKSSFRWIAWGSIVVVQSFGRLRRSHRDTFISSNSPLRFPEYQSLIQNH